MVNLIVVIGFIIIMINLNNYKKKTDEKIKILEELNCNNTVCMGEKIEALELAIKSNETHKEEAKKENMDLFNEWINGISE